MKKILLLFFIGFSASILAQDSYTVSSESKLTIEGTSTAHSWAVTANKVEGNLKVQNASSTEINFEVAVADIKSERGPTMDKKMHAALKKEEYPKVFFVLEQIKNESILVGMLTIAGMEKSVEIAAEITVDEDIVKIKGERIIVLQDFGIEPPSAMFGQIIVGDEVTVKFDLLFEQ